MLLDENVKLLVRSQHSSTTSNTFCDISLDGGRISSGAVGSSSVCLCGQSVTCISSLLKLNRVTFEKLFNTPVLSQLIIIILRHLK